MAMNEQLDEAPTHARISPVPSFFERLRLHRWFLVVVVLPTFLSAIYYGLIASDVYVSEARFVVKSTNQRQPQLSTLANLIQTTGLSAGQEQANEILDYLRSRNALADLEKRIDVHDKFSAPEADLLSRFPQVFREDAFENLYKFYGSMVSPQLDSDTGTSVLVVKAFTAKDAHDINVGLLDLSEDLVNRLNERSRKRAISEAEQRVTGAQERVLKARLALRRFRNEQELIDPAKQAGGVLEVTNRLVAEQASLQAQLEVMERVTPANPNIPALRSRIAALGNGIAAQTGRVVGTGSTIASKLSEYEKLVVEQEFATQMLNVANASLEQARSEAQKQQFYLERVVEPNTPDLPLLPHRLRQVLIVAAASLCLYFIGWMLIVGILEHAPED